MTNEDGPGEEPRRVVRPRRELPTDEQPRRRPPTRDRNVTRRRRPQEGQDVPREVDRPGTDQGPETDEEDYVLLPRTSSAPRKVLTVLLATVLILGTLAGGTVLWASRQINPSGPQGAVIDKVTIPKGASVTTIADILAREGIIANQRMFTIYVGLKNKGGWKAGDYIDFRKNSGFDDVLKVLDGGPVPPASKVVRIKEGIRLIDALGEIAEQTGTATVEELQAALDSGQVRSAYKPEGVGSWEGLLFPDTYEFAEDDTPAIMLQKMATKMDSVLDSLGYDRAEALAGRSAYELVVIASLIERETGQPAEERAKISRVISNRLDEGEPLGIDAAILYGLGRHSGGLTKSDLDQETPYNTRKVKGLPPTPIALPGEASLKAAIEPASGTWRYYVLVSNDPPSHFFTDSYKEFTKQKADAQKRGVF